MQLFRLEEEEKNVAMTEYEQHGNESHFTSEERALFFLSLFPHPLSPNRLSATLNNSLTVRADLAHQLTDKYLKRKGSEMRAVGPIYKSGEYAISV